MMTAIDELDVIIFKASFSTPTVYDAYMNDENFRLVYRDAFYRGMVYVSNKIKSELAEGIDKVILYGTEETT